MDNTVRNPRLQLARKDYETNNSRVEKNKNPVLHRKTLLITMKLHYNGTPDLQLQLRKQNYNSTSQELQKQAQVPTSWTYNCNEQRENRITT